jgi:hypothetical protein
MLKKTFPTAWANTAGINTARVFFTQNLLIIAIAKYPYFGLGTLEGSL